MAAPDSLKPAWISPEEYLRLEALAEEKHEYVDGMMRLLHEPDPITGMAGSSTAHIRIVRNIASALPRRLSSPCENFGSDAKVRLKDSRRFYYPDATISCDPVWSSESDGVLDNPSVVFEVLSPRTQTKDKGEKVDAYLALESVAAVVLVSSTRWLVEIYDRQSAGTWLYQKLEGTDAVLELVAVGIEVPLKELYDRVELEPMPEDAVSPRP